MGKAAAAYSTPSIEFLTGLARPVHFSCQRAAASVTCAQHRPVLRPVKWLLVWMCEPSCELCRDQKHWGHTKSFVEVMSAKGDMPRSALVCGGGRELRRCGTLLSLQPSTTQDPKSMLGVRELADRFGSSCSGGSCLLTSGTCLLRLPIFGTGAEFHLFQTLFLSPLNLLHKTKLYPDTSVKISVNLGRTG